MSAPDTPLVPVPSLVDQPDPNGVYRAVATLLGQHRLDWAPTTDGADPAEPVRDQQHPTGAWVIGAGLYATWQPSEPTPDPDLTERTSS